MQKSKHISSIITHKHNSFKFTLHVHAERKHAWFCGTEHLMQISDAIHSYNSNGNVWGSNSTQTKHISVIQFDCTCLVDFGPLLSQTHRTSFWSVSDVINIKSVSFLMLSSFQNWMQVLLLRKHMLQLNFNYIACLYTDYRHIYHTISNRFAYNRF